MHVYPYQALLSAVPPTACMGKRLMCCIYLYTVHGFANTFYDVEEGERLDMVFKVNVKGTTGFPSLLLAGDITSAAGPNTSEFYYIYHLKIF